MDTCFVKMAKTFGDKTKDETYEMDTATADQWTEAGLCEKVASPVDDAIATFKKELEERDDRLVKTITKSLNSEVKVKFPAQPRDEEDKSFGEFISLVGKTASKNPRTKEAAHNTLVNKYVAKTTYTGLNQTTTTEGGYLVPDEQANELLQVAGYEGAAYPNRVRVIPMQSDKLYIPVLDQTVSPSSGSSAFVAGCSVGVVAETNAPAAETQPAFKQLALTAKKLMAYTPVSQELLDNSPISVETIVTDCFRKAIVAWIDYNVFNGAGGSTALTGIIDHASTISVNRNTASDVKLEDLASMYARFKGNLNYACWFVNQLCLAKFPLLGNSNHLVWLPNGANGRPEMNFLGIPIVACESLPALGSSGDVVLADLSTYVVGVNKQIQIDASSHYGFTSDLVYYRVTTRVDGIPMLTSPIYLQNGTDTVSPYIQLDSATS